MKAKVNVRLYKREPDRGGGSLFRRYVWWHGLGREGMAVVCGVGRRDMTR